MFKKISTTFLLVSCYAIVIRAVPQLLPVNGGPALGGLGTNQGGLVGGVTNPGNLLGGLANPAGPAGGVAGAATGVLSGAAGGGLLGGVAGTTVGEVEQIANGVHVPGH